MSVNLNGWLILGLLLGTAIYAIAEDITLTTYYPSPRGVYQELKTAGDMVVGDITNPPGARLHVVQEGTAPALRVDDAPGGDTSPLLVDASGNVGIGTASPAAKLEVAGNIQIVDGTQGAGRVLTSDENGLGSWQLPLGGFSNMVVYATPGFYTFTVPSNVTTIMVEVWGGGGGGAGGVAGFNMGGGGGGGGYGRGIFAVTPETSYTVAVGAGGAGATFNTGPGSSGGASSFGSLISATGGSGGGNDVGGIGGTSVADFDMTGGSGNTGCCMQGSGALAGVGGDGANGGTGGLGAVSSAASPGLAPGGGGGGSANVAFNGANGGSGRVAVWW